MIGLARLFAQAVAMAPLLISPPIARDHCFIGGMKSHLCALPIAITWASETPRWAAGARNSNAIIADELEAIKAAFLSSTACCSSQTALLGPGPRPPLQRAFPEIGWYIWLN